MMDRNIKKTEAWKDMENLKFALACLLAGLCWGSLCMDWDIVMYVSGILAIAVISFDGKKGRRNEKT